MSVEPAQLESPTDAPTTLPLPLLTKCPGSKMVSVVSCNIRKCALKHATEAIVHMISSATGSGCSSQFDYILLQECSSWAGSHIQLGSSSWQVYGNKDNHTAIAVRESAHASVQSTLR